MADCREPVWCSSCKLKMKMVFNAVPNVRTDDNNPWRHYRESLGERAMTREGVKQLEAEGVCLTNKRDRSLAQSRRGRGAREKVDNALDELRSRHRIQV